MGNEALELALLQEYRNQQKWRDWEKYLQFIPLKKEDVVLDLGCSVGNVSRLLALRLEKVIGIDINHNFINYCNSKKLDNEEFICADISAFDYSSIGDISGIWSSFSLSYIQDVSSLLKTLHTILKEDGWIALLDVSCFISGNLSKESKYYQRVKKFELDSHQSGLYDFDFGTRMKGLLQNSGFSIIYSDHDISDRELNFAGSADNDVLAGWSSRLKRMKRLRDELGKDYPEFCQEFMSGLKSDHHEKRENVKFVVAKKLKTSSK